MSNSRPFDETPTLDDPNNVLETFLRTAEEFEMDGVDEKGYIMQLKDNNAKDASNKTFKISIGPIEIILEINFSTWSASLKILFKVPLDGVVTLANVVGNLKEGIEVKIGYPKILGGTIGVKLVDKAVIIYWNFHVFTKTFKGEKKIFGN
ncbi:hypothetical protein C0995_012089 [Termitomyces sp. Mi166|nr:hypothetical protein C0995_012089 [Termitomyces sp. Mi166\